MPRKSRTQRLVLTLLGYYPERSDKSAPDAIKDLTAKGILGGKVQLSWTSPAGESVRYQVKWADRPMVERLQEPETTNATSNWWAASHVACEPRPRAAGIRESMIVEGLPIGKKYFAIRSFDAASNRSEISNMADVEIQ